MPVFCQGIPSSLTFLTAVVVIFNVFITELMAQRDYAGVTAMEETVIQAVEEQFHNTKIKDRHMVRFRDYIILTLDTLIQILRNV